ncbi:hypothetical protein Tco_0896136 [Tanacetum coccineum]
MFYLGRLLVCCVVAAMRAVEVCRPVHLYRLGGGATRHGLVLEGGGAWLLGGSWSGRGRRWDADAGGWHGLRVGVVQGEGVVRGVAVGPEGTGGTSLGLATVGAVVVLVDTGGSSLLAKVTWRICDMIFVIYDGVLLGWLMGATGRAGVLGVSFLRIDCGGCVLWCGIVDIMLVVRRVLAGGDSCCGTGGPSTLLCGIVSRLWREGCGCAERVGEEAGRVNKDACVCIREGGRWGEGTGCRSGFLGSSGVAIVASLTEVAVGEGPDRVMGAKEKWSRADGWEWSRGGMDGECGDGVVWRGDGDFVFAGVFGVVTDGVGAERWGGAEFAVGTRDKCYLLVDVHGGGEVAGLASAPMNPIDGIEVLNTESKLAAIEEMRHEQQLVDYKIKDITNDLGYKRFHGEKIDKEYERDCEIRIQKLKQDFKEWGSEARKKEQSYNEEQYSTARRRMLSITFDDNDEYSIQTQEYLKRFSSTITPVLPIEEPDNSISMGDEHLDTTPSIENLVPIPSEFEGISDDTSDVPTCDNNLLKPIRSP